ncbi:MAG: hypothetical protein GX801_08310 [Fibrobacter sp.]|nr:hypothetical protein [Fibrobacter sp.]
MRTRVILWLLGALINASPAFYTPSDTLFIMKDQLLMGKYAINKQVDSLAFSGSGSKGSLELFKKSKSVASIKLNEIDSIVFYNPVRGSFIDGRDEQSYAWTQINGTIWMAENLRYLPKVVGTQQLSDQIPYYYVYSYESSDVVEAKKVESYVRRGALYNWHAADEACPDGWRLPTQAELGDLLKYAGGKDSAAWHLKAAEGWLVGRNGADTYGFSAIPGGYLSENAYKGNIEAGFWWTADTAAFLAQIYSFYYDETQVDLTEFGLETGASVRCLFDESLSPRLRPVELSVNNPDMGHTSGAGRYAPNQEIKIQAHPQNLHQFTHWSGPYAKQLTDSTQAEINLTMPFQGISLEANFKPLNSGTITDPRDGQKYTWQLIGTQIWLSENLRYAPHLSATDQVAPLSTPAYFVYDQRESTFDTSSTYLRHGVLYNWNSAQAACPEGWHLPSAVEWEQLISHAGGSAVAARRLSATGDNPLKFSAYLSGYYQNNSSQIDFLDLDSTTYWWARDLIWATATEDVQYHRVAVGKNFSSMQLESNSNLQGASVRCIFGDAKFNLHATTTSAAKVLGAGLYNAGQNVQLHALANSDQVFSHWSGDVHHIADINNPMQAVRMPATDIELVAHFVSSTLNDSRDGKAYRTTQIGAQVWMAENLKYLPYLNGVVSDKSVPMYYVYDFYGMDIDSAESTTNYEDYGVLYNWSAAMAETPGSEANPSGVQGVCPAGWHLPSQGEWEQLLAQVEDKAGEKLKADSGWKAHQGTDDYDFSALAGGYFNQGKFLLRGENSYWWSSTDFDDISAYGSHIYYQYDGLYAGKYAKDDAFAVRCVRGTAKYPLNVEVKGAGKAQGAGNFEAGSVVKLSAQAEVGYLFSHWSGDTAHISANRGAEIALTMPDSAVNLVANFTVYDTIIDARDSSVYRIVKIANETWLAENLRYAPTAHEKSPDDLSYGALYDHKAALRACPAGWHLPDDAEWESLVKTMGGSAIAGQKLRSRVGWPGDNGSDDLGFAALPAELWYSGSADPKLATAWWSAETNNLALQYYASTATPYPADTNAALAVRCVKGEVPAQSLKITPNRLELAENDTAYLEVEILPVNATDTGVVWASADTNIVKVNNLAKVFAISTGATFVYATSLDGSIKDSIRVLVNMFTDYRDGTEYRYVTIGTQVWMAENLRYLPSLNGTDTSSIVSRYYVYGYRGTSIGEAKGTENYQTYGALYNWPAALTACPAGWHLPDFTEWDVLAGYVGGRGIAGRKLKAISGWYNNGNGIGQNGFAALPGGGFHGGSFYNMSYSGYWWSATEYDASNAYYRYMNCSSDGMSLGNRYKRRGRSVRCVKD